MNDTEYPVFVLPSTVLCSFTRYCYYRGSRTIRVPKGFSVEFINHCNTGIPVTMCTFSYLDSHSSLQFHEGHWSFSMWGSRLSPPRSGYPGRRHGVFRWWKDRVSKNDLHGGRLWEKGVGGVRLTQEGLMSSVGSSKGSGTVKIVG